MHDKNDIGLPPNGCGCTNAYYTGCVRNHNGNNKNCNSHRKDREMKPIEQAIDLAWKDAAYVLAERVLDGGSYNWTPGEWLNHMTKKLKPAGQAINEELLEENKILRIKLGYNLTDPLEKQGPDQLDVVTVERDYFIKELECARAEKGGGAHNIQAINEEMLAAWKTYRADTRPETRNDFLRAFSKWFDRAEAAKGE